MNDVRSYPTLKRASISAADKIVNSGWKSHPDSSPHERFNDDSGSHDPTWRMLNQIHRPVEKQLKSLADRNGGSRSVWHLDHFGFPVNEYRVGIEGVSCANTERGLEVSYSATLKKTKNASNVQGNFTLIWDDQTQGWIDGAMESDAGDEEQEDEDEVDEDAGKEKK